MKTYKHIMLISSILLAMLNACNKPNESKLAQQKINLAYQLLQQGNINQAQTQLDSVHLLYPKQIKQRRTAKHLQDSITLIQAQRTAHYSDSLLQTLLPKADQQFNNFKWEKNDKYEDQGRYVHKLLNTDRNTQRSFIQCYLTQNKQIILKSYYCGPRNINQQQIQLNAQQNTLSAQGNNHTFQDANQVHEIMTLNENDALNLLQFISEYQNQKIKVILSGTSNYSYFLQDSEKKALEQTYSLAILLKDIQQLEKQLDYANRQIQLYSSK